MEDNMKKEISDWKKNRKDRIKQLNEKIAKLQGINEEIIRSAQLKQQEVARNNTEIIKCQGGLEELEKQIKG